jgi:outer membrane protein TolC
MRLIGILITISLLQPFHWLAAEFLPLDRAERIAVATAPELAAIEQQIAALREESVAVGQLPDPALFASTSNVPVDTFSFTQDNMTQIKVGLLQAFPRGHSLRYQTQQKLALANAQGFRRQNTQSLIVQSVRVSWFELYYWLQARRILDEMIQLFQHLVDVTQAQVSAAKKNQHDALQARLELSQVKQRRIEVEQQIEMGQGQLIRWLGVAGVKYHLPDTLPGLAQPFPKSKLAEIVLQHPLLATDQALITAEQKNVQLAKEQYKPSWELALNYGFRQGQESFLRRRRADFFTAEIAIELPMFTSKRQDKVLVASEAKLQASYEDRATNYRKLIGQLEGLYGAWEQLLAQEALYQEELLPEAERFSSSVLIAYQNNKTDFTTVVRAYEALLNTQLAYQKTQVERAKVQAGLLYIQGERK